MDIRQARATRADAGQIWGETRERAASVRAVPTQAAVRNAEQLAAVNVPTPRSTKLVSGFDPEEAATMRRVQDSERNRWELQAMMAAQDVPVSSGPSIAEARHGYQNAVQTTVTQTQEILRRV